MIIIDLWVERKTYVTLLDPRLSCISTATGIGVNCGLDRNVWTSFQNMTRDIVRHYLYVEGVRLLSLNIPLHFVN